MGKVREQLEVMGCKILEETPSRIIASCPVKLLEEGGMRVEGVANVKINRVGEDEVRLEFEKSGEE